MVIKRLLDAAQGIRHDAPPVWMMRQAGRFLPEYRAIREKLDTLSMFRTPKIAAEITLQPLRRFPFDAAIVYADILLIPDALGQGLSFVGGEGPVFAKAVRTRADLVALQQLWNADPAAVMAKLEHLGETLSRVKPELSAHQTLIGFAGAPWTVACYMIEGKGTHGEFFEAKKLSYEDPELVIGLIELLTDVTLEYLKMQIRAGAEVLQLFESWGLSLSAAAFRKFCAPSMERILSGLAAAAPTVPVVYFVNGVGSLLKEASELRPQILGLDWRVDLQEAISGVLDYQKKQTAVSLGKASAPLRNATLTLQGNLDPMVLFGSEDTVRQETRKLLAVMKTSPFAHIFNLGHGLRPQTPMEAVGWCVDEVIQGRAPK